MSNHLDHFLAHADFELSSDHGLEWALGDATLRGPRQPKAPAKAAVKSAFEFYPVGDNTSDITGRWRPQAPLAA